MKEDVWVSAGDMECIASRIHAGAVLKKIWKLLKLLEVIELFSGKTVIGVDPYRPYDVPSIHSPAPLLIRYDSSPFHSLNLNKGYVFSTGPCSTKKRHIPGA